MTVYRTCRRCAKSDDCPIRDRLSDALRGFKVGTITHRCDEMVPLLIRGEHVWAKVRTGHGQKQAVFPAVFVEFAKALDRCIVFIEPGAKAREGADVFQPMKSGFCRVSYAPLRWPGDTGWIKFAHRAIVGRREGKTFLRQCCGLPEGRYCDDCKSPLWSVDSNVVSMGETG